MSFVLRFTRRFSMAHRLIAGQSTKCATPHGHNELVTVDLVAAAPAPLDGHANMVTEFARAKGRWHRFVDEHLDHALQLSEHDPLLALAGEHFVQWRLVVTPGDPTTELLAALLAAKCGAFLAAEGTGLRVARVTIEETPTNAVVFEGNPHDVLPAREGWWSRADDSTR
ncbi:MAG: 6-carboxytetrahydropterin synthase [Myxococcales bacterium]|nr:6-carboxytetrahydropterin synthase [Myxococcales bacterium]